jgi:hypothetical protein
VARGHVSRSSFEQSQSCRDLATYRTLARNFCDGGIVPPHCQPPSAAPLYSEGGGAVFLRSPESGCGAACQDALARLVLEWRRG